MRISRDIFFCPKCKKRYVRDELTSFYGGMASQAEEFVKNNKVITHCENCRCLLIPDCYLKYFDENGEFVKEIEILKLEGKTITAFVRAFASNISVFKTCFENTKFTVGYKIEIERGKVEENDSTYIVFEDEKILKEHFEAVRLNGYVILNGCENEKEHELLKVRVATTYNNIHGTRFNDLELQHLVKHIEIIIEGAINYISDDEKNKNEILNLGWINEYDFYYDAVNNRITDGENVPDNVLDSKLIKAIARANPHMIKELPEHELTTEDCLNAVRHNKFASLDAIRNIPESLWNEELAEVVINNVKEYAGSLSHVPEFWRTEKICLIALKDDCGYSVKYIPKILQTEEFFIKVVKATPNLIKWIPDEIKTEHFLTELLKDYYEENRLKEVVKHFNDKVTWEFGGIKFELYRHFNHFKGTASINKVDFMVFLNTDDFLGDTAYNALNTWKDLIKRKY